MAKTEDQRLAAAQEKRVAALRGGTLSAGSGNQWRHKNDVRERDILWEMKRTSNPKQITIKATDLEDLRTNAKLEGRLPVLHVELGKRRCVILLEDDFLELVEDRP